MSVVSREMPVSIHSPPPEHNSTIETHKPVEPNRPNDPPTPKQEIEEELKGQSELAKTSEQNSKQSLEQKHTEVTEAPTASSVSFSSSTNTAAAQGEQDSKPDPASKHKTVVDEEQKTPAKQILEHRSVAPVVTPIENSTPVTDPYRATREATIEIQSDDNRQPSSPGNSSRDSQDGNISQDMSQDMSQDSINDSNLSQASNQSSFLSMQNRGVRDAPRKRRRTTPHELEVLEAEFSKNNRPGKTDRERIAKLTSMDEKAVQVWFQNKRQSHRRQHNLVTPAVVRTQSLPAFQDENSYMGARNHSMMFPPFGAPAPAPTATHSPSMHTMMGSTPIAPPGSQMASPPLANHTPSVGGLPTREDSTPFRMGNHVVYGSPPGLKNPKSLKLSMSADGKAELVERSPLKPLSTNSANTNTNNTNILPSFPGYPAFPVAAPPVAMRYATMPAYQPFPTPPAATTTAAAPAAPNGIEEECASSLMVLKFGKWS